MVPVARLWPETQFIPIRTKCEVKVLVAQLLQLFVTPWTVAHQVPLSMRFFFWQEYWKGLPFPSPGDLPNPGIELGSPALQADSFLSVALGLYILPFYNLPLNDTVPPHM